MIFGVVYMNGWIPKDARFVELISNQHLLGTTQVRNISDGCSHSTWPFGATLYRYDRRRSSSQTQEGECSEVQISRKEELSLSTDDRFQPPHDLESNVDSQCDPPTYQLPEFLTRSKVQAALSLCLTSIPPPQSPRLVETAILNSFLR